MTPQNVGETDGDTARQNVKNTNPQARPEYASFARALRAAMLKQKLSASEVARRVWGTTKDTRGYDVARNRDRIGHYLNQTSYPEPENLQLLADAVGLPVEELAIDRTPPVPGTSPRHDRGTQVITFLPDDLSKARLQIDRMVEADLAIRIVQMIKEAERPKPVTMPPSGRSFGKPEPELRGPASNPSMTAPTAA